MLYILMPCRTYAQTVLFQSDFENTSGDNNWVMQGGATDGDWVIGAPSPYTTNGIQMEIGAFEGNQDLVTGNIQNQDVDGGPTRARSPSITLPTSGTLTLEFDYYFSYYTNSSVDDHFRLEIRRSSNDALLRSVVNDLGNTNGQNAAWQHVLDDITAFAGETIYIRVQSIDISNGSKVEAAVDLVKISTQSPNNVQGQVFDDSDNDGVYDASEVGVGGVAVALYDANGLVTQTTTAPDGSYSFGSLTQGTDYQIIFSGWGTEFTPSIFGADSKGPVIYVEAGENGSFGLYKPDFVCSDDPYLIIPCYVEGVNGSVASEPAIVKVRSSADGHDFTGGFYNSNYQGEAIADYSDVGTVYGIAYQSKQSRFYASAFHKRYASYGPSGADAIYQLDLNGNILGTLDFDVLTGVTNSTGGDVHDFTTLYNGDIVDLGSGDVSFDAVGKRGFGDIEMSSDDSTMYVVNLFDRKIYALDVGTGQLSDVTIINSWSTPDPTGAGRHRPFGLAYHDGQVWLGSVDENGQSAYVHSLDLSTGSFTLELTIPLQFERQAFFGLATNTVAAPAQWNPWQTNTSSFTPFNIGGEIAYPQPMLSDIEFDASGDMVIGFRDRFGDQSGADKHFNSSTAAKSWAISQGDIMKACAGGSSFVLESGPTGSCPATFDGAGNAGPGGQEFYYWDFFEVGAGLWDPAANGGGFHWETAQGGLYQIDGKDYIISTAMDPIDDFSGGYVKFNNITGGREGVGATSTAANLVGGYTIYDAGDYQNNTLPPANGFAAKANGLGDIEGACDVSSAIGNYVWFDTNQDGLQMAGEPGLANVIVELYKDGVKIGEVITDSKGYYFFGGPNNVGLNSGSAVQGLTNYDIRIEMSSAQANDGSVTTVSGITAVNSGDDSLDSDALTQGSYAFISITTTSLGINDYSFDFGFTDCLPVYADNLYSGCQGDGYSSTVGTSIYDESNSFGTDTLISSQGCDSVVTTLLSFDSSAFFGVYLQDTAVTMADLLVISGAPNDIVSVTGHMWTDLGLGSSTGYLLSGVTSQEVTLDPSNATSGSVFLEYQGVVTGCTFKDTILVQILGQCTVLISDDFEGGLGNWDDPGTDCTRLNSTTFASNGSFSIRLRDNTATSMTTSIPIDMSSMDSAIVDFSYIANSMEPNEDFWLQISRNASDPFVTIQDWVSGSDFNNNVRYFEQVNVSGPFSTDTRFRFVCDASGNGDQVYLDEIVVSGCEAIEPAMCPEVSLQDTSVCMSDLLAIKATPDDTITITSHMWTDLGTGTASGYQLSDMTTEEVTIDPSNGTTGSIFLEYKGSNNECTIMDTVLVQVFSNPLANIISEVDTICSGASITLMAEEQFLVQPDSGMVVSSSGQGVTLVHDIEGVLDPNTTKIIITLPTWDDHFDSMLVNGLMVLPKILEQASYNAQGMNCQTPWIANVNGLPRSILEITSTEVKYFSSLTPNSTVMTQVFPTNWTTTPQPLVEGFNQLQFGIQNTAGPVSGSWFVEVQSEPKIYYEWSTGDTTSEITVNPVSTTTYMLTVTAPNGCESIGEKTIYAGIDSYEDITYQGCSGDGYAVSINGNLYDEANPTDTLSVPTMSGCDSIYYINLTFDPPPIVEAGDLPGPLCSSDVLNLADLQASITGGILTGDWTSAGGGVFDNNGNFGGSNPATTYTPSEAEINDGKLILTLTSDDPPGSCEPEADAVMVLINDIRCSSFPWSGGQ